MPIMAGIKQEKIQLMRNFGYIFSVYCIPAVSYRDNLLIVYVTVCYPRYLAGYKIVHILYIQTWNRFVEDVLQHRLGVSSRNSRFLGLTHGFWGWQPRSRTWDTCTLYNVQCTFLIRLSTVITCTVKIRFMISRVTVANNVLKQRNFRRK